MSSLLRRIFGLGSKTAPQAPEESFAARFHRFRLFLHAHMDAYSELLTFEERLADELPLSMPFLRSCTTRLSIATMQCIMHLQALSEGGFTQLNEPFTELRANVQQILDSHTWPLDGPLLVQNHAITQEHAAIISPNVLKLETIWQQHPEFIPLGFVITGAAWWQMQFPALREEIDRIMLISQEDPNSFYEAAMTIRERMLTSFSLPEALREEIANAYEAMKDELAKPGNCLLIRCLPVRHDHGALSMQEQVIRTPITDCETLCEAVLAAFAMPYRPRAMVYRLKLGIRDKAMPFCICLSLLPQEQARGSAHLDLDVQRSNELIVRIRRNYTTPEGEAGLEVSDMPAPMLDEFQEKCQKALLCLSDAHIDAGRHEVYWVAGDTGDFYIIGAMSLPAPHLETIDTPLHLTAEQQEFPAIQGGESAYPGLALSATRIVRNLDDALLFPIGSILLVQQAAPRWAFLLDFATGAVSADGSTSSLFAQVARRYGRPTIVNSPQAVDNFADQENVLLLSNSRSPSALCACPDLTQTIIEELPALTVTDIAEPTTMQSLCERAKKFAASQSKGHNHETGHLWLSTSDIATMARNLAPLVAELTLPDVDSPDFRASNCKTFHDFITYCHDHAVREMFRYGTTRKSAQAPAKQLVCDVPKQFWVINLDDGFYHDVPGPTVQLEEIASLPMRTLWEGFAAKPWDGPPQLNAKGFLSVLFEATQNPNLDPAAGGSHYTEKNVFLISQRFCSMRCRFGFHFLSLDCLLSERQRESFIIFQFKGGAANLSRRIRRVHFVAELLAQFECSTEIVGDTLTARVEGVDETEFLSILRVIGYLVMHTRQLDMIMSDEQALTVRRIQMLEDMLALAAQKPMQLSSPSA